jgi:hypothetical protein
MSRNFQSSYHSSNDYKKYKQEKLGMQPSTQSTQIQKNEIPSHFSRNDTGLSQRYESNYLQKN